MSYRIQQSTAAYALLFYMVQSSDHITALTGATPTVTLSKNGGSFASPSGTVSEIANGWYKVAANSTDSNTLGPLALHATATSGDPTDMFFEVVADDLTTSPLHPTVAGRTLDVASTGEAGLDFANVNIPVGVVPIVGIVDNGTLQSATGTTAVIRSAASFPDSTLVGMTIQITGGSGVGQSRIITAYANTTKTVTVDAWTTNPSVTSTYIIYGTAGASASSPPTANVTQWNNTAVATPATAGIPEVNVKNVNNVPASSVTTVGANVGTTQPLNFTGSGGSALVKSDMQDIAGAAVGTSTAQIGVNVVSATGSYGVKKNTTKNNYAFYMTDSTTHAAKTGVTVTAQRSIDGAAFAACANSPAELSNGCYKINLAAGDLNGDVIILRFTGTGADDRIHTILTSP